MANITKRTYASGKTAYRVQIRLKGHPSQTATFLRKTDAIKWAQSTEASIREGRYFQTVEAKRHTLGEAIDRYIASVLPQKKPSTIDSQHRQLLWWRAQAGDYALSDVTSSLIAQKRDLLLEGSTHQSKKRSPATVKRYLAALSHVLTITKKEWGWIETNPVENVVKPQEPRGRVRCLSEAERQSLLDSCKESSTAALYPIVVLALGTGMRKGEILALRWCDVDFSNRRLIVQDSKNGERRAVHLAGPSFEAMQEHSKRSPEGEGLVFPGLRNPAKPAHIRAAWLYALERADIKDFRFHDLRHCTASYLAMSGASLAEIAEVLGHKSLSMVKRYAHLTEGHTASVVERMSDKFLS